MPWGPLSLSEMVSILPSQCVNLNNLTFPFLWLTVYSFLQEAKDPHLVVRPKNQELLRVPGRDISFPLPQD